MAACTLIDREKGISPPCCAELNKFIQNYFPHKHGRIIGEEWHAFTSKELTIHFFIHTIIFIPQN